MAVEKVDDSQFQQQLEQHEKVVVKYYADWCGSCRLFTPKYKRLSESEQNQGIAFLDVNAEHNPAARKMAGVTNLPFFAVFRNGQLVDAVSTSKEESVTELINKLR